MSMIFENVLLYKKSLKSILYSKRTTKQVKREVNGIWNSSFSNQDQIQLLWSMRWEAGRIQKNRKIGK